MAAQKPSIIVRTKPKTIITEKADLCNEKHRAEWQKNGRILARVPHVNRRLKIPIVYSCYPQSFLVEAHSSFSPFFRC